MIGLCRLRAINLILAALLAVNAFGATRKHKRRHAAASTKTTKVVKRTRAARRTTARRTHVAATTTHGVIHTRVRYSSRRHRKIYSPWTEPTFADSTVGDVTAGDDPVVRKAAVDALGPYNGSVVVVNPETGRILSVVNQKLALAGAYQPCSTVKIMVSFASLSEGLVDVNTPVHLSRRSSVTLTQAIARSNNAYFAKMGEELGFDRVEHYAKLFGLGEKAGYEIPGEKAGTLTATTPSEGVGMMTSFGSGIRLTPLELASIVSTVANGGTMYYLQYPQSKAQLEDFQPRIKRSLDIADLVPSVRPGMMGAVEYGTARRANFNPDEPIFGKTGTCTDTVNPGVHLGWFGSFSQVGKSKVVVVVLLTGGRGVSGPVASGIAGQVYRNLATQNFVVQETEQTTAPVGLIALPALPTFAGTLP
jgi:membrane carboxypeptidase/penicillin-binding protein